MAPTRSRMPRTKRARSSSRSRFMKRRRTLRRSVKFSRRRGRSNRNFHKFSRWNDAAYDTVINCTSSTAGQAINFQLQKVVNPTEFSALYDRYMISRVIAYVQLITNPDASVPTNSVVPPVTQQVTNWYPTFWWCSDYDDDTTPSFDDLKQRTKTKCFVMKSNVQYKLSIKPAVNVQTYATAVSAGYSPKWKTWIDMGQLTVPHYGMKCIVDAMGLDPNDTYPFQVRIRYKYYFACKDVI